MPLEEPITAKQAVVASRFYSDFIKMQSVLQIFIATYVFLCP